MEKTTSNMDKNLEIKTIEFNGIKVRVKIDYDLGIASLVEPDNQPKKWVFASRGLEYMNGWLNIIEAMTSAVKEIKKDLERDLAEKSKFQNKRKKGLEKIIYDNAKVKRPDR